MSTLPLLPEPEKPKLIGIARLAAQGESIREGHNIEYFTLPHALASEPLRQQARTSLRVGRQSLPRLRICLQVLLRALYPRVHGDDRRRFRAQDLRQTARRQPAAPRTEKSEEGRGDRHR